MTAPGAAAVWMCPECGHGSAELRDERAHLDAHRQLRAFFREWEAGTEAGRAANPPPPPAKRRSLLGTAVVVVVALLVSVAVFSRINREPDSFRAPVPPTDVREVVAPSSPPVTSAPAPGVGSGSSSPATSASPTPTPTTVPCAPRRRRPPRPRSRPRPRSPPLRGSAPHPRPVPQPSHRRRRWRRFPCRPRPWSRSASWGSASTSCDGRAPPFSLQLPASTPVTATKTRGGGTLASMFERLAGMETEYEDVLVRLQDPNVFSDQRAYVKLSRRLEGAGADRPGLPGAPGHLGRPGGGQGDAGRVERRRQGVPAGVDRGGRGHPGPHRRGAEGPAPAPRPQRRPQRHRRDPGRRGRGGGQPLRQGPARDVRPLRRPPQLEARGPGRRPVRHGRVQRDHLPGQGRRRVEPHEARGRAAPGPAGAGHRVAGPHPHQLGHGHRPARGRGGRRPHRPERPQDRRLPLHRPGRAVGEHHRLRRAHHPPAHRPGRGHAGREEPDPEPGPAPWSSCGPGC